MYLLYKYFSCTLKNLNKSRLYLLLTSTGKLNLKFLKTHPSITAYALKKQ